mmetsp:Transcript_23517/g.75876  ORF Transcript_23517/g.75876 Transcript_23517/m.75876 type:complete len:209 (+) Transcript_23517:167-793(+)
MNPATRPTMTATSATASPSFTRLDLDPCRPRIRRSPSVSQSPAPCAACGAAAAAARPPPPPPTPPSSTPRGSSPALPPAWCVSSGSEAGSHSVGAGSLGAGAARRPPSPPQEHFASSVSSTALPSPPSAPCAAQLTAACVARQARQRRRPAYRKWSRTKSASAAEPGRGGCSLHHTSPAIRPKPRVYPTAKEAAAPVAFARRQSTPRR